VTADGDGIEVAFHCAEEDPAQHRVLPDHAERRALPERFRRIRYQIDYRPFYWLSLDGDGLDERAGWVEIAPHGWFQPAVGAWLRNRQFGVSARNRAPALPRGLGAALILAPGAAADLALRIKHVSAPTFAWPRDNRLHWIAIPLADAERRQLPRRGVIGRARWNQMVDARDRAIDFDVSLESRGGDEWGERVVETFRLGARAGGPWLVYCGIYDDHAVTDVVGLASFGLYASADALALVERVLAARGSPAADEPALALRRLFAP
jgi:hypothetical protein